MKTVSAPPVVRPTSLPAPIRWAQMRYRHRHAFEAWIILTPILLYYLIFAIIPVIANVAISFTRWNGISAAPVWIGLSNYARYLKPPYPLIVLNTTFFAVTILLVQTLIAFFIALLLNEKLAGRGAYRALWYIPTLTSAAIMAQLVNVFTAPYGGVINNILQSMGRPLVIFTISGFWMRSVIIVFSIWRGVGGPVVLFLAALQGINPEIQEAAMVDGAGGWARIRSITLPLLRPMMVFVLVTGVIGAFQIFEAVQLISKGGPFNQTNVMLNQIYNDAFVNSNFGVATAGATIMGLILLAASYVVLRSMREEQG
ncbi:MAG: sugar ABC transporter permease [Herpetosiphonaceae bacterium]|nr:sugar ABC transporter permease [Herpetosiphonaceae bacterium]